jgi:hypothetical protein
MDKSLTTFLRLIGLDTNVEIKTPDVLYKDYLYLEECMANLEEYRKVIRESLFDAAMKYGAMDNKGSYSIQFSDGTGFKKEARTSVKLDNERAVELLMDKNLLECIKSQYKLATEDTLTSLVESYEDEHGELPEGVEEVAVVDEAALEQAVMGGEITDEELKSVLKRETTYALKKLK